MMATDLLNSPPVKRPKEYPFHIGTRLVNHRDADGKIIGYEYVPLTEEDYLHPQEEDRFLSTDRHAVSLQYLNDALAIRLQDLPRMRAFCDHRMDWQIDGIEPHGPDVVVFDHFDIDYDDMLGTMRVKEVGADVVAVFEVTSESTRHIDFGDKFDEFLEVGIPYFIVIDAAAPNGVPIVMGFRWVKGIYRELRQDPKLGVLVPPLSLWFRWERDRLVIADEDGKDIPSVVEVVSALEAEKANVIAEKARTEAEKAKAEAEKARADALALEVAELKAKLAGN